MLLGDAYCKILCLQMFNSIACVYSVSKNTREILYQKHMAAFLHFPKEEIK